MFNTLILPLIICIVPILFFSVLLIAGPKIKFWKVLFGILLGLCAFFPVQLVDEYGVRNLIPPYYPTRIAFISFVFLAELIKGACITPLSGKKNTALSFLLISMLAGLTFGCGQSFVEYLNEAGKAFSKGAQLLWLPLVLKFILIDLINMACTGLAGLFIFTCKNKTPKWLLVLYPFVLRALFEFFNVKLGIKWFSIAVVLLALLECRIKYKAISNTNDDL